MLRKNPDERITAEQALAHPYFKTEEESEEEECEVGDQVTDIDSKKIAKGKVNAPKDSLVSLKMGKENPINGKTDTEGSVSSKLSFGGNLFGNKVKSSNFNQQN